MAHIDFYKNSTVLELCQLFLHWLYTQKRWMCLLYFIKLLIPRFIFKVSLHSIMCVGTQKRPLGYKPSKLLTFTSEKRTKKLRSKLILITAIWLNINNNSDSQNAVGMQPKFCWNAVKIQSKCSQNSAKIQPKFSQNSVKIQSFLECL